MAGKLLHQERRLAEVATVASQRALLSFAIVTIHVFESSVFEHWNSIRPIPGECDAL